METTPSFILNRMSYTIELIVQVFVSPRVKNPIEVEFESIPIMSCPHVMSEFDPSELNSGRTITF